MYHTLSEPVSLLRVLSTAVTSSVEQVTARQVLAACKSSYAVSLGWPARPTALHGAAGTHTPLQPAAKLQLTHYDVHSATQRHTAAGIGKGTTVYSVYEQ